MQLLWTAHCGDVGERLEANTGNTTRSYWVAETTECAHVQSVISYVIGVCIGLAVASVRNRQLSDAAL